MAKQSTTIQQWCGLGDMRGASRVGPDRFPVEDISPNQFTAQVEIVGHKHAPPPGPPRTPASSRPCGGVLCMQPEGGEDLPHEPHVHAEAVVGGGLGPAWLHLGRAHRPAERGVRPEEKKESLR